MSLVTDNIRVALRPLPEGNWELAFDSPHAGLYHQLYVGGRLRDCADTPAQRRFLLPAAAARQEIAVVAVAAEERATDFSAELSAATAAWACTYRVCVPLDQPGASPAHLVLLDDHAGLAPVSCVADVEYWPPGKARYGQGQDLFGLGGFGLGGTGAPGLGLGLFARGPFGLDVQGVTLEAQLLEEGLHTVTVAIAPARTAEGGGATNNTAACGPAAPGWVNTATVLVLPPPEPVAALEFVRYDPATTTITLHIE
jgi:hypothetical protein